MDELPFAAAGDHRLLRFCDKSLHLIKLALTELPESFRVSRESNLIYEL